MCNVNNEGVWYPVYVTEVIKASPEPVVYKYSKIPIEFEPRDNDGYVYNVKDYCSDCYGGKSCKKGVHRETLKEVNCQLLKPHPRRQYHFPSISVDDPVVCKLSNVKKTDDDGFVECSVTRTYGKSATVEILCAQSAKSVQDFRKKLITNVSILTAYLKQ